MMPKPIVMRRVKLACAVAVFGSLLLGGIGAWMAWRSDRADDDESESLVRFSQDRHFDAGELKVCPNGHLALKDVPIAYGLIAFQNNEQQARWDQRVADFEVWPGGCCVTPDSPRTRVVCTNCGSWVCGGSKIPAWAVKIRDGPGVRTGVPAVLYSFADFLSELAPGSVEFEGHARPGFMQYDSVSAKLAIPRDECAKVVRDLFVALADGKQTGISVKGQHPESHGIEIVAHWKTNSMKARVLGGVGATHVVVRFDSDWR